MEPEQKSQNYILSQQFQKHTQGVRSIDTDGRFLISGSTDKSVQIFTNINNSFQFSQSVTIFDQQIYAVKVRKNGKGFFVGGKEGNIFVIDIEGNPLNVLSGHTSTISSLYQSDDQQLISGSWDATAKIWDLQTGLCQFTLEGHQYAVSVVATQMLDLVITGSQDKSLRFWELSTGKSKKVIQNAHSDIIREIVVVDEIGFLTASNDETLKFWTFEGEAIQTYNGHSAFIFTAACIQFGLYVSGSDDKTVKLWNDSTYTQSISHPGTIWSVCVNPKNQDIITACGDCFIRIFTTDKNRQASELDIEEFQKQSQLAQAQGPEGMSQDEVKKLPAIDMLKGIKGKRDGEVRLFKNLQKPEAYVWKEAQGVWEKIGDVISEIPKKFFEGDEYFQAGEYDYIFDVEDESGVIKKLPYNEGESMMQAAELYCHREKLSKGYIQQIRDFLRQNTKSGQQAQQKQQSRGISQEGFMQQEMPQQQSQSNQQSVAQQQQKASLTSSQYFPINNFISFDNFNIRGLQKKVLEFNEKMKENGHKLAMVEKEVKQFDNIVALLENTQFYHTSKLTFQELDLLNQKLFQWPVEYMLPIYDLLRIYALHSQSEQLFSGLDSGLGILTNVCGILMSPCSDVMCALLLKLLCNLFIQNASRYSVVKNFKLIYQSLKEVAKRNSDNQPLWSSLATLIVNMSIDANQRPTYMNMEYLSELMLFSLGMINKDKDPLNLLKYLAAIGTQIVSSPLTSKPIAIFPLSNYICPVNDQKVLECLTDLKSLLT